VKRLLALLCPAFLLLAASVHPASALTPDMSWICPQARYNEGGAGNEFYQLRDNPKTYGGDVCTFTGGGSDGVFAAGTYTDVGYNYVLLGSQDDSIDVSDRGSTFWITVDGQGGDDTITGTSSGVQVYYGGAGNDTITGGSSEDDIFGGDYCEETNLWGFWEVTDNESLDNYACSLDGGDVLKGGAGDDFIWDSNSDTHADGHVDDIHGNNGNDTCVGGAEDTFSGCETITIIPDV
jgi:Ca2+-binding RTX toxin-like protein